MRPMQEGDVDTMMALERVSYEFPWTPGIFHDCLREGYCCLVYILEERIIGYGVMSMAVGEAHILNICIEPRMRGQGMGRHLIRRLLGLAAKHHVDTVFLEVRASNSSALSLYHSLGFNELGRRHGYYPASWGREDAVLFALTI